MSVGLTLFKIGMTGAIVAGVLLGARQYQRAQARRVRAREPKALPSPPVGGDCASWGPIYDDQGTITGLWADGGSGQPRCVPACAEGYAPVRTGEGDFDWACVPPEEPEEFPASDPCMAGIYSRAPIPPEAKLYEAATVTTRLVLKDLRMHLDYPAQQEIMLALLDKIGSEPSVRSVMVRRVLEDMATECDWWVPEADMLPSQRLAYASALELSRAAETEMGWEHPVEARKNMIPREYLGIPSSGTLQLVPGQHVELLVVEGPQMRFAEHLIARTLQGGPNPRVVVVPTFMGADVSPRFADHHGFDVNTQVVLESTPPTSVYRIYPKDWS